VLELSKLFSWKYNITFDKYEKGNAVDDFKYFVNNHIELVGKLSAFKKEEAVA
jgi:hypothetical protein